MICTAVCLSYSGHHDWFIHLHVEAKHWEDVSVYYAICSEGGGEYTMICMAVCLSYSGRYKVHYV